MAVIPDHVADDRIIAGRMMRCDYLGGKSFRRYPRSVTKPQISASRSRHSWKMQACAFYSQCRKGAGGQMGWLRRPENCAGPPCQRPVGSLRET